jgi:hypothetical protein
LVALALIASTAFANEHGAAPPEGAEGGEGKAAAPPRDQKEFAEKSVKLSGLASKLEEARKRFAEVVKEKEEARTAAEKVPYLKEMVEIAKQRDKDQLEYDKLKSEIAQRYPNQGAHVNRHIEKPEHGAEHGAEHGTEHAGEHGGEHATEHAKEAHHDAHHEAEGGHAAHGGHASEKITAAPTLDDLLDQTKILIDQKYAPFNPKPAAHGARAPASAGKDARPARLRLEK